MYKTDKTAISTKLAHPPKRDEIGKQIFRQYGECKALAKSGQYTGDLKNICLSISDALENKGQSKSLSESSLFNIKGFVSEIMYLFGNTDEARRQVDRGGEILAGLLNIKCDDVSKATVDQKRLWRQQCRYCVSYLIAYEYRDHRFSSVKAKLLGLAKLVSLIHSEGIPSEGLLAYIYESLGKTLTHLGDSAAVEFFSKAIDLRQIRLRRKAAELRNDKKALALETQFTQYRFALSMGLGFGYIGLRSGENLTHTLHSYIAPALALIEFASKEDINAALIRLLGATIRRCLIGKLDKNSKDADFVREQMSSVIDELTEIENIFAAHDHQRYIARARYQKSLCFLFLNDYVRAINAAREVEEIAKKQKDIEWQCFAMAIISRIQRRRKEFDEAIETASTAAKLCNRRRLLTAELECLLSLGKAYAGKASAEKGNRKARSLYARARGIFQYVLVSNADLIAIRNPETAHVKVEALALLHIAETYLDESNLRDASEFVGRWNTLSRHIDHYGVKQFGKMIEDRLDALRKTAFSVSIEETNLEYKHHDQKLRKTLIELATFNAPHSREEQAKLLGVKLPTLFKWIKDLRETMGGDDTVKKDSRKNVRLKAKPIKKISHH